MKRQPPYSLLSLLLILYITGIAKGQDKDTSPFRLGTTLGVGLDIHGTSHLHWDESEPGTPLLGNITGFGGSLGIVAAYRLSPSWELRSHITYTSGSAEFSLPAESSDPYPTQFYSYMDNEPVAVTPAPSDSRTDASYEYFGNLRYQRLDFDLLLERTLSGNSSNVEFSAGIGPVIYGFLDTRHDRWFWIRQDSKDNIIKAFTGYSPSQLFNDGKGTLKDLPRTYPAEDQPWQFGIRGGFSATFGALNGTGITASPGIYADYGLTNLIHSPASWKMISLTARLDVTVPL